ncbi:NAD(P)/FAD-dependent oxidoreductase [Deinococcus koreensis]|uniref:FAD-dependent oxidoreductase n=1 Tax=Deinococcus koreensis TaxID=2054903 RepID=A0A2K3USL8_9DEIO|nr:FAD-dependent oxidoreductase [Deinococcus koreensis]PNY79533.1 FAD-dependent oxidoreductase [Deinococcus koreensis]
MRADIVVIGAGIIGAACAWRLAERGLKVVVIERGSPAGGSTGRSVAGVRHQFGNETNILLARESIAEYAAMPESGYRAEGYLMLVPHAGWERHRAAVELQRRLGVPTRRLTPQEAQAHVPFVPDGLGGCSHCALDGRVDAHSLTSEYVRRARSQGALFLLDTPVTGIRRRQGHWEVSHPTGRVEAPLLLNAAGAWSGGIGTLAGLDIPVWPARRMVFTTAPLKLPRPVPMVFDLASGVYLRSEGERLILGRADPRDTGWREGMDWDWLEPTLEAALGRFPWLEAAALDRRASWWGYYELTPDEEPIVGRLPGAEGWINACGFSGHGVMQAAAIGRVVAQLAVGETPFIDLSPLRYERFAEGDGIGPDIQV